MPPRPSRICFGDFAFDPASGELWRRGRRVRLQRQPSRLLELLLANPGELVGRDEIRAALWGDDTHVDFERSLNFCVARLRSALRDNAAAPSYIETVPTRGYRFIAPVTEQRPPIFVPASERRRLPWGVTAAVLAAIAFVVALRYTQHRPAPTVLVVPFNNETGSADLDRVAKGVSDATVARLAASSRLRVIGNASGLTFTFRPPDLKAMGESLGAQYLVLGQMKRDERQLRIVAHLIRVADQTHVWARTYDSPTLDLRQQDIIAAEIAVAIMQRIGKA
ncbi:MAG TPA: winged helix-turn-helix domain-containing protein [Vicinamibacterales bacterium]|nr:winged helix-turn-helix domain-containing protein [Vicinamibacterales bacterium]